jgi:hypothetical protein
MITGIILTPQKTAASESAAGIRAERLAVKLSISGVNEEAPIVK